MHTRVRICVCVPSRRACLQPGRGVERVWVCLAVDRKVLQSDLGGGGGGQWVWASPRTGQPSQRVPRPSVWSLTSGQGALPSGPTLDPARRVSGLVVPGEAQLGRDSVFFKSLFAASEIPSPSQANCSICAFRSLKIHSILTVLGTACAAHLAAEDRRRGRKPSCPSGEGLGSISVPRDIRSLRPSGLGAGPRPRWRWGRRGPSSLHPARWRWGWQSWCCRWLYKCSGSRGVRAGPGLTRGLLQRPAKTGA